ncbi:MAG: tRNA (guanosine(46)-N7)-methyltransferase TrmB [Acidobacteriota bacterium]|nr:tRNA (guanosine(46)-N7)-methyltransferase TrmB [Acidobacteriota bacterium]
MARETRQLIIPDLPVSGNRPTHELVRHALDDGPGAIELSDLFGNDRDVELEVGVGKGRFLLLAASARPETNFLGIEYARKYLERAIDRIGKRGLTNVRLLHAEAVEVLRERLPEACLSAVHVLFPDPWPKKRHHKRRFFRGNALDQLARVMRRGAVLRAVTDHDDYAEIIREVTLAHGAFEALPDDDRMWQIAGMADLTRVGVTNFEIKYRREGRSFHRLAWRRR